MQKLPWMRRSLLEAAPITLGRPELKHRHLLFFSFSRMQNGSVTTNANTLHDASNSIRDLIRCAASNVNHLANLLEDDDDVGPRDSYHYASMAISGNSKNPFSLYDSDDEDDKLYHGYCW